jgi:hypothetical protein
MGLDFGWRANDTRDTIWREDTSLVNVPSGALSDWNRDGDASHLLPYAKNGKPEVFTFRALSLDESRYVLGILMDGAATSWPRALLYCFRIAVDFPQAPEKFTDSSGKDNGRSTRVHGIRMLADPFCFALEVKYPGIIAFYGQLIYAATFPSEAEKKASLPPSTQKPLLGADRTKADTVEAPRQDTQAA